MRLLSLFVTLCFPLLLSAQIGWVKGYVVTNSQDTLHGKILYTTLGQRSAKCVFKEDGYDDKVKYKPFTIKGYYVKEQYFISRVFDIHPSLTYGLGVFMRLVNEGESPVTILDYRNTDFEYGFNQIFLVKKGEPSHEIDPMRFRKTTAPFFSDYPELHDDILAGKYKRRDLQLIVKRYNNWYGLQ